MLLTPDSTDSLFPPSPPPQPAAPAPDSACHHLLNVWASDSAKDSLLRKFKSIVVFSTSWRACTDAASPARRLKTAGPECSYCHATLTRPFVCLHCSFAGCWRSGHIQDHMKSRGHNLAVDAKSATIYCLKCDDFIQSSLIDACFRETSVHASQKLGYIRDPKKAREQYTPWLPSEQEELLSQNETSNVLCQGRRGLLNLGQTCAMNTVLQSFVHNPLLRNYFLSDRHNSKLCSKHDCMCCEMDKLFVEIYSGENTPHGPLSFLPVLWRSSGTSSLSEGYAQHDAHEVFITCLSQIHTTSKGSTNVSCNCVIHSTFYGGLSSEVRCGRVTCGHVSVKVDPMVDISLELRGKTKNDDKSENTLMACLRRFTQPEKLLPKEYTCEKCNWNAGATKSLSIRKLSPVLAFQLKRFGHRTLDKSTASKINTPIRFPAVLNMAPYTTLGSEEAGPDLLYTYDLFCVINHEGAMDNGHYTNYARFGNEWYKFDDDKVTFASLSQVLGSVAYLLFYVKRHLDYKPDSRPTYVQAREAEIQREKQREREKELKLTQEIDEELMSML